MTVIMASTFKTGVALAADTLLHDARTMNRVMNAPKTLAVGKKVAIAQAGRFSGTERVWELLKAMDGSAATPAQVADIIRSEGGAIYASMAEEDPKPQLRYIVAGIEDDGVQAFHVLQFDVDDFEVYRGAGNIIAIGAMPHAKDIATQAVIDSLKPFSNYAKLDEWVQRTVRAESEASPATVGFPATLVVITPDQLIEAKVEAGAAHDPRLVGFFE